MLDNISYAKVFGFTVVFWLGVISLILMLIAGVGGFLDTKGITRFGLKTHMMVGAAAVIFGLIHGILAILAKF